ncbi:glycerophosphoryl diester phosphodiesterase [Cryobacterium mesophilum]|nr:glycerophosphodiester phosphodiesterase family protein [Terrimesophilobacter mesophilus]MBB5634084.1 glycerophosphoryl diester phosphodiesterase [Terrimesophilobacter mesophilus]
MATAHHPRARAARRWVIVSALFVGFLGVMVLGPGPSKVEASNLFGGLRAPGEAAFIAGHRGDRSVAPENTMASMQAALDGPMEFVEADIQLTRDGIPVLLHDTFVNRTTNGSGRVGDLTLRELQELDAGSWYSPAFARTRIPTLESLLSALQAKQAAGNAKKALLELKGYWSTGEVRIVTDLIADYGVGNLVIMSSFDLSTIDHLGEADGTLPVAIITSHLPNDPVGFARLYGAMAIITSQSAVEGDLWVVDRMHRAGLGLVLYTLNTKSAWKNALALGVDGVITDRPDRLDRWLLAASEG